MGKRVVLSSSAKAKLSELLEYLENKWSPKVKNDFIKKLDESVARISNYPKSCPESRDIKGLFKCVVTSVRLKQFIKSTKNLTHVTQSLFEEEARMEKGVEPA